MSTHGLETDASASIDVDSDESGAPSAKRKLALDVDIKDAGPCKKHLKISIPRAEIDRQFDESVNTLRRDSVVPGFRPGHAPKQLVIKRFKKQVSEQVKSALLMASLEQIDADYKLDPITQPRLDVEAILLPEEGPLNFEMDVEVRPDFTVPNFKQLRVMRPTAEITEKDVDLQLHSYLEGRGQVVPKLDGAAELGDYLTADLTFRRGDAKVLGELRETEFRLQPEVRFQNGSMLDIGSKLAGVKPGETRVVRATLGSAVDDPALRGATIDVEIKVNDLKRLRLPELNAEFLASLDFESVDEMRLAVRQSLERRLEAEKLQAMRAQIVDTLLRATPFELPTDLVSREEKNTVSRLVSQLKHAGKTDNDIRASAAQIRANAHETTLRSLKEFLLLAKIAEVEGIKVEDEDLALEVEAIAERTDESVRRVRARIEKEGGAEPLATQILERKVIDHILKSAEIVDHQVEISQPAAAVETLDFTLTALADEEPAAQDAAEPSSQAGDRS